MSFPNVKWFQPVEFYCKDHCGLNWHNIDPRVIELADQIRQIHGGPIKVISSCRCSWHNYKVGGARHSRHIAIMGKCRADALDITPIGCPERFEGFIKLCQEANVYGHTIYYPNKGFVHVDIRGERKTYEGR